MPSLRPFDQASGNAQIELTDFATEFEQSFQSAPDGWGRGLGLARVTRALRTRYPINISNAGYRRMIGNRQFRQLGSKYIEVIGETWQDGVAELARVVESDDFMGWDEEPTNMANALAALPNALVATLLAGGESATGWDGISFFHATDHPVNVLDSSAGTFGNLKANYPVSIDTLEQIKTDFRNIKSPIKQDGKQHSLGLELTHILAPVALVEGWKNVLEKAGTVGTVTGQGVTTTDNRHQGTADVVKGVELSEDNYYYAIARNKSMKPWLVVDGPREEQILDKSSAMYEASKKVGWTSEAEVQAGLAHPACIFRCKITA